MKRWVFWMIPMLLVVSACGGHRNRSSQTPDQASDSWEADEYQSTSSYGEGSDQSGAYYGNSGGGQEQPPAHTPY